MRYNSRNPSAHSMLSIHSVKPHRRKRRYFMPCMRDCRECVNNNNNGDHSDEKHFAKRHIPNFFACTEKDNMMCKCITPFVTPSCRASRGVRRSVTKKSLKEPYSDKYLCLGKLYFMDKQSQTKSALGIKKSIKVIKEKNVTEEPVVNYLHVEEPNNKPKATLGCPCKRHKKSVRCRCKGHSSSVRYICTDKLKSKLKCLCTNTKSQKTLNLHKRKRSPSHLQKIEENTEYDIRKDMGDMPRSSELSKPEVLPTRRQSKRLKSKSPLMEPPKPEMPMSKKTQSLHFKSKPTRKKSKIENYVSDICARNKCNRRCRAELDAKILPKDCTTVSETYHQVKVHKRGCLKLNLGSQQIIICTCKHEPKTKAQKIRSKLKSICCPENKKKKKGREVTKKPEITVMCDKCGCPLSDCECQKALKKRMKRVHRKLMKERKKKYKRDKKELKKLKKQAANTPVGATNIVADCAQGLFLLLYRGLRGIVKMIMSVFDKPTDSWEYVKARAREPEVTWGHFSKMMRMGWRKQKQRINRSVKGSESMKILEDAVMDTGLFQTFQNKGKTLREMKKIESENRKRHRRNEKRQNQALYSCRHMLLLTLRNRPCLWVYYICPYLYPQCLSLLSFWKNFTDILLFGVALLVWTPCITCVELFRGLLCCCLCTH